MRLSAYQEKGFKEAHGYRVLMDGRQLNRVLKVDTCTGVAWVHDVDKSGRPRFDPRRDEVVVRKVYGPMRVERIAT